MRRSNNRFRGLLAMTLATAMLSVISSAAIQYWGMVRLDRVATGARHGDAALALAAEDMRKDVLELRRYEKDIFMNIGTETLVHQYKGQWDRAFLGLRYDLAQARRASSAARDVQLEQVIDEIATYHAAFTHIFELIADGTIRTTQQANAEMSTFKESVRKAEISLENMGDDARARGPLLDPAVDAQQLGLAVSFLLFLALAALLTRCLRSWPSASVT